MANVYTPTIQNRGKWMVHSTLMISNYCTSIATSNSSQKRSKTGDVSGLLEPCAGKARTHGSEGGGLEESSPPTRHGLERVGDPVKLAVAGRMSANGRAGRFRIFIPTLETGPVVLRIETAEPDAGLATDAAAHEGDGAGLEADAEDFRDLAEIIEDRIVPVVVEAAPTIP